MQTSGAWSDWAQESLRTSPCIGDEHSIVHSIMEGTMARSIATAKPGESPTPGGREGALPKNPLMTVRAAGERLT